MRQLTANRAYRRFAKARDFALENILQKHLIRLDQLVDSVLEQTKDIAAGTMGAQLEVAQFELRLAPLYAGAAHRSTDIILSLRRMAYILSYASEGEAIARASGKELKGQIGYTDLEELNQEETEFGGSVQARSKLSWDRLKRRVVDAFQVAHTRGDTVSDLLQAIEYAFPRTRMIKRPAKALVNDALREAEDFNPLFSVEVETPKAAKLSSVFVEPEVWDSIVGEYLEELPFRRGAEDIIKYRQGSKTIKRYEWELERDTTHDFVAQVRAGKHDVAKENGITDFVWIAVIDNRTDECCVWRDGLTTKEIREKLRTTRKDDPCETDVPPAHPNCRCDIAPITKEAEDLGFEQLGDFESWLKT